MTILVVCGVFASIVIMYQHNYFSVNECISVATDNTEEVLQLKQQIIALEDRLLVLQKAAKHQELSKDKVMSRKSIASSETKLDQIIGDFHTSIVENLQSKLKLRYSVLFKELNLSIEEQQKLDSLLLELHILDREFLSEDSDSQIKHVEALSNNQINEIDRKRQEIDDQIKVILGATGNYALYQNVRMFGDDARLSVNDLELELEKSNVAKLTTEQLHQLTLLEVNATAALEKRMDDEYSFQFPEGEPSSIKSISLDEKTEYKERRSELNKIRDQEEKIYIDKLLTQASNFLSFEQLDILKERYSFEFEPIEGLVYDADTGIYISKKLLD